MRRLVAVGLVVTLAMLVGWGLWRARVSTTPSTVTSSCSNCHQGVTGIDAAHASVDCAACHLGHAGESSTVLAHQGLVRVPGNLSDMARTCGQLACHPAVVPRIAANVMTTMNGVVSVDRHAFGEQPTLDAVTPVTALGFTPADLHLRNLCASCHLGTEKKQYGPIDELSRGGGCNACHLRAPARSGRDGGSAFVHAAYRTLPEAVSCAGCHARSGRISLSFSGWSETESCDGGRRWPDGRCLAAAPADVHAERGFTCVDCHGSWEVMGRGEQVLHHEGQALVGCEDCHRESGRATRAFEWAALDPESQRVIASEGLSRSGPWVAMRRSGLPLVNARSTDAGVLVQLKTSKREVMASAPSPACRRAAHRRLSCTACHTAWAPTCVSCHTRFEADGGMVDLLDDTERPGEWVEQGAAAQVLPPSLGRLGESITTFVPGMIMTLDLPDAGHRLTRRYAPISAHTTRKAVRECSSCHLDARTLGYGSGALRFANGRWHFAAATPLAEDGLPRDSWVPFSPQRDRGGVGASTRSNAQSLSVVEQQRALTVGACLTCHPPDSAVMQRSLDDFATQLGRRRPSCQMPRWYDM